MSKIKEALNAIAEYENNKYTASDVFMVLHLETIKKSLNAIERMKGVDLDELIKATDTACSSRILHGARGYYLPEDIETLENAARIVADIKKEVKG